MKRFLLRGLYFLLFVIPVYFILLVLSGLSEVSFLKSNLKYKIGSYGHMNTRIKEADTTKKVDILFLGSSHSYRSYDPRFFSKQGYKIFNLGSSAQTPIQTEVLLDRYLHTMKPKLVVFDVFPALLINEGVESSLDLIANGPIDSRVLDMTFKINNLTVYNTLIYGWFRQTLQMNEGFREPASRNGDTYIPGGFVQTFRRFESKRHLKAITINPLRKQVKALDRIIKKLKTCNIPYLLVQAPITNDLYLSFNNNDEMDHFYQKRGRYYNFNKIIQFPDSLFFDEGHLNQFGANIYNEAVLELIKQKHIRNN